MDRLFAGSRVSGVQWWFMAKIQALMAILVLLTVGCVHQPITEAVTVSGGQSITFTRVGPGFVKAENESFVVDESGLTTYRTGGKNFVRWKFAIMPRKPVSVRLVKIEDITGDQPIPILEARYPRFEERSWVGESNLIPARTESIPWLFDAGRTIRVFRITLQETTSKTSTLYQAVLFTGKAKKDFRVLMGPETAA
jgi:hypothetical protein